LVKTEEDEIKFVKDTFEKLNDKRSSTAWEGKQSSVE
jgi:hypothetical protein